MFYAGFLSPSRVLSYFETRTNGFCFTSQYKNVKADVSPLACLAASARSNNMFVRAVPFRSLERHQL